MNFSKNNFPTKVLTSEWYQIQDVTLAAKRLLGKVVVTEFNGLRTSGIIVETEAYNGIYDKACHAFGNRRTPRTEVMYAGGGVAYVYLCYGIHHLFNVVTNRKGVPDAVLIRAIEPLEGIEIMLERRKMPQLKRTLTSGPGVLSSAMGISTCSSGAALSKESGIWIEDHGITYSENELQAGPRIGVAYAEEHALLPWRFSVKKNPWVSSSK